MNNPLLKRAPMFLAAALLFAGCIRNTVNAPAPQAAESAQAALVVREADSPAGADSREPELSPTADGRAILSWVEKKGEKGHALRFALRDAGGWSEARTVAEGDNWFVNWADFPSVIALADGSLAAHWLVKSGAGTYAYDVNVARSGDGGKTWGRAFVPHTDGTQTEHGFVSLLPLADGRLGAVWVDGRALKDLKEGHEEDGPLPASMQLRYAAIDGQGRLSDEAVLDERICECCQTAAAMTAEGPVVAYRDRSEQEVRDIHFVRRQPGGWSAPRPAHADNWQVKACPVNGPQLAADGRRVALAWFTGEGDAPRVQVAFSSDAGATFGRPARVDDGEAMGRVDVLLLADGSALVCWMSGGAAGGANKVRRVAPDGTLGPVAVIARTDASRSSGFPRMARLGDTVLFAWTQFGKPSQVRTATADVSAFR
ncbi:MAG TPA: sialidase family protein [Pyrinomonadaceae bacterium]|nr:sialidase family protein [Pyrinomonadaceae bacterium]